MNHNSIIIDKYLQNELSETEKQEFESKLNTDSGLREELHIQQQLMKAAEKAGLKNEFAKAISKRILIKRLIRWTAVIAVAGAAFIIYAVATGLFHIPGNSNGDKQPLTEQFEINNSRDTIIETDEGVIFAIPARSFNTDGKYVRIEIKTAIGPHRILRMGLSTTSNGQLLQTAGMFSINGYENGRALTLSKNISVSVPAKHIDPGMQLFDGVEDSNGRINWVNPKPIARNLRTYDIATLDFYPPDYIPTLKALNRDYQNKKYTDSLYYSFSGNSPASPATPAPAVVPEQVNGSNRTANDYPADSTIAAVEPSSPDGGRLFKENCQSCHKPLERLTGPALKDIRKTIPGGDWVYKWMHNSDELAASGDLEAMRIKAEYGSAAMNHFPQLTPKDIDAILDYADSYTGLEIDPSKIKAIWDPKFNNTIIATKEFEERLRYIHSTCTDVCFQNYLQHLDKPIYWIDSLNATLGSDAGAEKFLEFAARRDGGVIIASGLQSQLSNYFTQKSKAYREAVEKTWAKYQQELQHLQNIADDKTREQQLKEFDREEKNFNEEFCANLTNAYNQIGIKRTCNDTVPQPSEKYYNITISTPGWKNLDQYVLSATIDRESMTYTDPVSGKVAKLIYNPVNIKIENADQYDKVLVYLAPDSLSSFQLVEKKNNTYPEKLNSLFHYGAVVLAYKGEQAYFFKKDDIQPGEHVFSLAEISEDKLTVALNALSPGKEKEFRSEFQFRFFEQKEALRQVQLQKDMEFREQVKRSVFKCFSGK